MWEPPGSGHGWSRLSYELTTVNLLWIHFVVCSVSKVMLITESHAARVIKLTLETSRLPPSTFWHQLLRKPDSSYKSNFGFFKWQILFVNCITKRQESRHCTHLIFFLGKILYIITLMRKVFCFSSMSVKHDGKTRRNLKMHLKSVGKKTFQKTVGA